MHNANCNYTALGMAWNIAKDIDISSNQEFKIFALNHTDPNAINTRTSPGFLLLHSTVSSTLSRVSTTASYSGGGILQTVSTPSDTHITGASTAATTNLATPGSKPSDLSSAAEAGIAVSCIFIACSTLLGTFFFFMRRRRQQRADRPELDGRAAAKKRELDEQHGVSEVMEARISTPVELPGDVYENNEIFGGIKMISDKDPSRMLYASRSYLSFIYKAKVQECFVELFFLGVLQFCRVDK